MTGWKITLTNRTGLNVDVMVFQVVPDSYQQGSYFTAWRVTNQPNPGNTHVELPETFEFYVIDYQFGDQERQTGPFQVKYGYEVKISQPNAATSPNVTCKLNEDIPQDRIKVINLKGNAQPVEIALFKKDRKMVFYKDVPPDAFAYMAIKPSVFMSVVQGVKPGQEFETTSFLDGEPILGFYSAPVEFQLFETKPVMNITITRKQTGEYVFTQN